MPRKNDNEIERRRKVVEEKLWGSIIENIERLRKKPLISSLFTRLFFLYQALTHFSGAVKEMGIVSNPLKTEAPPFTLEQTNFLITTYNDIITDLHSNLGEEDSFIKKFSPINQLDKPTINDVAKTLFLMGMNSAQIMAYLLRWKST